MRTLPHPVNLDALEQEVRRIPAPEYVEHYTQEPEPDIGRLSADAVLEQYNMAAKAVKDMGEEIQERIRALEAALRECDADMKLLDEAAQAIKEKGKLAHAEIERTSAVSKDIREVVAVIKSKLEERES